MSALPPLVGLHTADSDLSDTALADQDRSDSARAEAILIGEATDAYLDDLQRLRLRVLAESEPEEAVDLSAYERQVSRVGEELAVLETQLHALRSNSTADRFFFTPEQIRERKSLFQQIERDLAELRERRYGELAAILVPREREARTVSQGELLAVRQRRDVRIAQAIADLRQAQLEAMPRLAKVAPWPAAPSVGALALAPEGNAQSTFGDLLLQTANDSARESLEHGRQLLSALASTRKEAERLRLRARDEARTLASNFARDWGYELVFAPRRGAPDLTGRLVTEMTDYFHRSQEPRANSTASTSARAK